MSRIPPILVVEDDPDDAFLIAHYLSRAGRQEPVLTFQDGAELIAYLEKPSVGRESLPCLIITDHKMPKVNGEEVIQWVKGNPLFSSVPVLMISGSGDPDEIARARKLGAFEYLTKFPALAELARLVSAARGAA
jgi:CheY-like chemotaxis protein